MAATVAVKVTLWPVELGFAEEAIAVVVGLLVPCVIFVTNPAPLEFVVWMAFTLGKSAERVLPTTKAFPPSLTAIP